MNGYIYSIVAVATAIGIAMMIAPNSEGMKKYVRLIASVCILCVVIDPTVKLIEAINDFNGEIGFLPSDESGELYDKYDGIYQNYLDGKYGENIGDAVKDAVFKRFGIKKENIKVSVSFLYDTQTNLKTPKRITLIISGSAILTDPDELKKFVGELFECEAEVAVGRSR